MIYTLMGLEKNRLILPSLPFFLRVSYRACASSFCKGEKSLLTAAWNTKRPYHVWSYRYRVAKICEERTAKKLQSREPDQEYVQRGQEETFEY